MALFENKKQIFILIAAIATGIIAAVMVSQFVQTSINQQTDLLARKYQKDQAAKEEVYKQQMQALNQKMVEVEQNAKQAAQQAAQQMAKQQVVRGVEEPKKEKKFVSLALRMPEGKRALTIMMDSLGAVGGLLSPGDYVDIISHLNVPAEIDPKNKRNKDSITAMIFQNIQILAINTNIDQPGVYDQQVSGKLRITFAVTPEEASLLSFAERNGKIELALRSPNEKKPTMISAATWGSLAEYVLQNTGADLNAAGGVGMETRIINDDVDPETVTKKRASPYDPSVEIYKGGKVAN